MATGVPGTAAITVPPWLWGNAPKRLFEEARLRAQSVSGDDWVVQTEESYQRRSAGMVTHDLVAGRGATKGAASLLTRAHDGFDVPEEVPEGIHERLAEYRRRAEKSEEMIDLLNYWQVATMSAQANQVPTVVDLTLEAIRSVTIDPTGEPVCPNPSAYLIRRSAAVVHRTKLASLLVRIMYDDSLRAGNISHLQRGHAEGQNLFASGANLSDGVYLIDAYLGPLLGALSPSVWAFAAHRESGAVIYALGRAVAGTVGEAGEMLHLLPSQGADESVPVPPMRDDAPRDAIGWWARALDNAFAVLTDPAVFTDERGSYVPMKHLQALFTVEQLFRRVASIQTTYRDRNARRVLLFTVLDTIERLTLNEIEVLCSLTFATRTLDELRATLPGAAADVLLPAAERAVASLRRMQDGFFLAAPGSDDITFRCDDGTTFEMTRDAAAATYVRVLRDATHGHGSNRESRRARTNALLAHHTGYVPHDLAMLGYLYLLRILSHPETLKLTLYRRGRV